jgi:hypothetical protein
MTPTETNEERADDALKSFEYLVGKLEAVVDERISTSQPMGGLPHNPNQFLTVWQKNFEVNISRSTYYKDLEAHSLLRDKAEDLYKDIKYPPIVKSERDLYENKISALEAEREKFAEKNLEALQKLRDIDFKYREIILKKDDEIRALKRRIAVGIAKS